MLKLKKNSEPTKAQEPSGHPYDKNLDRLVSAPSAKELRFLFGRSLFALGLLALLFVTNLLLISQVQYLAAQSRANETFRYELANGTAPVAQVDSEGLGDRRDGQVTHSPVAPAPQKQVQREA